MKLLTICLLIVFIASPTAIAYPEDQLKECVSSAKQNPNIQGVSDSSIENYCDCALKLIVDKGQDRRSSGYECASKAFGWLVRFKKRINLDLGGKLILCKKKIPKQRVHLTK